MPNPFLFATDFSDAATDAADAAAALAAKFGEPLLLAHVFEPPATEESLADSLRTAAGLRLSAEAERLRQGGASVEEELLEGSPYEAIAGLAERSSARLVVMASHRKRSLPARWFFGGVAERIVKTASVPCLVLRDAAFVEEWLSGRRPLRVFVGADLSVLADAPLLWVGKLAQIGPCEIIVAYLNWVPDEASRLGLAHSPSALLDTSHQIQSMLENELRKKVGRLLGDLPVTIRVEPRWGRADLPLIDMAELAQTDLFVVGTRTRGVFSRLFDESVSMGVLHHAPMAVATIPWNAPVAETAPPPSFDRVLVATDFSDTANHAIPYACALVAPGGVLCLGHVVDSHGLDEAEAQRQLAALVPPHAATRGIRCETAVWHGRAPAEDIVHLAEHFAADAICIGSHGRTGVARALIGSVAQGVLAASKRPVLVVRKPV